MYVTHLEEAPSGELNARTNTGRYTNLHIRLNRPELLGWRRLRLRVRAEISTLQSLRENLALGLLTSLEFQLRDDLTRQLAALDSIVARLRDQFCL
jgi:hypothetical protein